MTKIRQLIKHELLNTLTMMNFILEEEKTVKKKQQLLKLVDFARLLVMYASLLEKKKSHFFLQETPLQELLETVIHLEETTFPASAIQIRLPIGNIVLKLDRYYMGEAIKQLLKKILLQSSSIEMLFQEKDMSLVFLHHGDQLIAQKKSLSGLFSQKNEQQEIAFQLALASLELLKVRIKEEPGKIVLCFPDLPKE